MECRLKKFPIRCGMEAHYASKRSFIPDHIRVDDRSFTAFSKPFTPCFFIDKHFSLDCILQVLIRN